MQISKSKEMYLKAIFNISSQKDIVRAIDIANYLKVSKAAVSNALKSLKEERYIIIDEDGYIGLTGKGLRTTRDSIEKYTNILSLLLSLGIDEETAKTDAASIQYSISQKTYEALLKLNK